MPEIVEQIEKLGRAWEEYKSEASKGRTADAEKLDRINAELDKRGDQIDRIETALKRTHQGTAEDAGGDWKATQDGQAFITYLRRGENRLTQDELKVLTVSDDTTGGYLSVPDYVREVIKGETEFSPIRAVARVRPTSNRAVQMPKRTGQFAAVWTGETETRTETTGLTYGLEEIPTHEAYALVDISQQDLEDPEVSLESELQMEFSEQFALAEGAAFVSGNGVKRPAGFMDDGNVSSDNSGSATTIADTNGQANGLIDLFHNLKTAYARNGTWLLNRKTLGAIRKMKDGQNNYVWVPGLAALRPSTILDAPYLEVPDMADEAANAFPIAFGDWRRAYLIIDRIQMSVLRDPFTQATSGTVRFIARRRVGGQVVLAEAIRKLKCAA